MNIKDILSTTHKIFEFVLSEEPSSFVRNTFKDTSLWYPISDRNLEDRLKGEYKSSDLEQYFRLSRRHNVRVLFEEYKKHLVNKSLNPHKEYEPIHYWVEPQEVTHFFDKQILEYADENIQTHIFHIGEKGVGKTITQNAWLYTRFEKIEEKKIFWLRCDGYKLYKLWLLPDIKKTATLDDYLDMQLLYVFAKYLDLDFFSTIYKTVKNEKETFQRIAGKVFGNFEDADMADYIKKFRNNLLIYESSRNKIDEKSSYAMHILQEAQSKRTGIDRARWNWISLSQNLQNFLLKHEYKILKIIDGVDNINLHSSKTQPLYEKFVSQIAAFVYSSKSPHVIKMVSLREKTAIDVKIKKARTALPDNERDNVRILEIRHSPPNFNRIFRKRWNYIEPRIQDIIQNLENKFKISILSSVDTGFSDKINQYYHNNVSTFLYNNLTLRMMIYYRWLQVNQAEKFSYDAYARIFRSRNLFLNGYFYLRSEPVPLNPAKKGQFTFSIFYSKPNYRGHDLSSKWQGFCAIRILQLLKTLETHDIAERDIANYIHQQFGYLPKQIQKTLNHCKDYGLIDTKMSEYNNRDVHLEISKKGDYFLRLVFSDFDVLYTFALDSYLPSQYKKWIKVHSNKIKQETEYASAAIVTTFLFLLFIMYIQKEEMEKFDDKLQVNDVCNLTSNDFQLPHRLSRIVKRAYQLYKATSSGEREIIEKFFHTIESISTSSPTYKFDS